MSELGTYEPVCLNDFMAPDRRKRYYYVKDLVLPFDSELFGYHRGGCNPSLWFLWKSDKAIDMSRSNSVIHKIEQDLPVYHTRTMQKEFTTRFSLVCKASPSVMNDMYKYLTNDQSALPNKVSKEVQERLHLLLSSQDPDIVHDLRLLNEGRAGVYDKFWDETEKYLNEKSMKAVDDRRHGTVCHMSVAISLPDLHEHVVARLPPNTQVPSLQWLYLQFMPQNKFSTRATIYTGRFNLKFMVQSRQINTYHPDAHYAAAIFKYLKEFAVKYRDYAVLMCVDDKSNIPVGEPGVPLATINRCQKTIVQAGVPLMAADHDTSTKCKLTPSTCLIVETPEKCTESFFGGHVYETLKDTIFAASSPLRHSAEMRKALSVTGKLDKPIRIIYSDGGADHRITYPSVQLSLIALYLIDDCDVLLAARCCPMQSYTNPAERWHSIMNLALQSVAVERKPMSQQFEAEMSKLNTMRDIRERGKSHPAFKDALISSLQDVTDLLNQLFGRLKLKGNPCIIGEPANDTLMTELWDTISTIDDSVTQDDTTTKLLQGKTKLQAFLNHCTVRRHYYFMISKCGDISCKLCKPPRLPQDVFQGIHKLPDPVPTEDGDHFKSFEELYGTETTEKFRPSLVSKQTALAQRDFGFRLSGETVRRTILCTECSKARCVCLRM
ncbi:uncharacterized protein [Ptychodera flava]|uniref:uncharacterized protein isoform X2 n=1 Tax=Ptychodera flava TaxID=63121 RepID=UPI00396A5A4B